MSDITKQTTDAINADRESAMKRRQERLAKQGKSVDDVNTVTQSVAQKLSTSGLSLNDKINARLRERSQKPTPPSASIQQQQDSKPIAPLERGDCPSKEIVDSLIDKHTSGELATIIAYISRATRLSASGGTTSSGDDFRVGDKVQCVSGPMSSVGITGVVTQVKKTRLWVDVPGRKGVFYPLKCDMIVLREKKIEKIEKTETHDLTQDEPKSLDDVEIAQDPTEQTGT